MPCLPQARGRAVGMRPLQSKQRFGHGQAVDGMHELARQRGRIDTHARGLAGNAAPLRLQAERAATYALDEAPGNKTVPVSRSRFNSPAGNNHRQTATFSFTNKPWV